MKRLAFFFAFILFSFSVFAQGEEGGETHSQCELNFQIRENTNQYTIDFVTTPVWNTVNYISSHTYIAGSGCNFNHYWQGYFEYATKTISLQGVTNLCRANGFHYGTSQPGQLTCTGWPNYSGSYFQSGLYYIVVKVNGIEKTNFYYDNRNGQFPSNPCNLPGYTANDIGVRYDVTDNKLFYMSSPSSDPFMGPWREFKKGEVLNWWEIAQTVTGLNFNGFNTRYFAILNEPQCINYSPYLTWQAPNVSLTIDHYELQRAYGSLPFQTIYTTNSGLAYHDNSIHWVPNAPNNNHLVQYRVVAVYTNQDLPHEYSNTQKLFVNPYLQKENKSLNEIFTLKLNQNYPNPFNPATKISYQIPSEGFVTLKVYNSLGQEIKTLVSESHSEGKYEIDFNAELLPSGIYFYRLTFGDYVTIQKMIYLK